MVISCNIKCLFKKVTYGIKVRIFGNTKLRWFLILYFIRKHENSACYTIPAWTMGSGYLFIGQEVIT